ncbi:nucleoside triphosphate pyrophosphatase [Cohnella sp. REN36]|uniref:Maf family protein n=1 Tax=Cohnella sp. REN36 TaxID=2887347 RepID=UPI001D149CBC|nr:Maf family protein [Cohnella sp. REN36]MCC3376904.1 Maf family protein [Cohnella sp. REN36]
MSDSTATFGDPSSQVSLVLASSSPRRSELIAHLGLPVEVRPSDASEEVPADWMPDRIVEALSLRKAQAVAERLEAGGGRRIVVGSDTIVVLDGEVMGKPRDAADAVRMLSGLAGRVHEVYTGVTCIEAGADAVRTAHRVTRVRIRALSPVQIERYVATGEPMDKAGAYGIQELGALLVEGIEGDYFNVVGLPLSLLAELLSKFGIERP